MPDGLVTDCSRVYGWCDQYANDVLKAYRQFMELKKRHRDWDGTFLSPPLDVERMWHQHVRYENHYADACKNFCGRVIAHGTTDGMDFAATAERIKTTQNSVTVHFYRTYDKEIWSFKEVTRSKNVEEKAEEETIEETEEDIMNEETPEDKENNAVSESRNIGISKQKSEEKPHREATKEITLVLKYPGDEWTLYNVPDNTRFKKIFEYFAKVQEKDMTFLLFKHGDKLLQPDDTPMDCDMNAKKVVIEVSMDEDAIRAARSEDSVDFGDCVGFCTDFGQFVTLQKRRHWTINIEW